MVTHQDGSNRAPRATAMALVVMVGAQGLAASGCSTEPNRSDGPHRAAAASRPATADACTVTPRRPRVLGLPATDAETVRIARDVVGEKVTWRSGPRMVIAWVGVDALDEFEDLDFVPVHVDGRSPPREWTTQVRPDLFVVEARTGHPAPCDLLYVSTEGLPGDAALEVADALHVALTPGEDVTPP